MKTWKKRDMTSAAKIAAYIAVAPINETKVVVAPINITKVVVVAPVLENTDNIIPSLTISDDIIVVKKKPFQRLKDITDDADSLLY